MAYTTTKTTSYGTRLGNSIKGVFFGFVMFIAGTILLWWNEGRAVKTAKAIENASEVAVHVDDVSKIDPSNDGSLIHATAMATTTDSLVDDVFGIGVNAISLSRDVEYYQYVEHSETVKKDKVGGAEEETTTYTYKKEWTRSVVNSANFKDPDYQNVNMVLKQYDDNSWTAENVTFGAYTLPENMIRMIGGAQALDANISDDVLSDIDTEIGNLYGSATSKIVAKAEEAVEEAVNDSNATDSKVAEDKRYEYVHTSGNTLYIGKNPNSPQVGDVRITFKYIAQPQKISLIAKVSGNSFTSFKADNGETFLRVQSGEHSMEEMFQAAQDENTLWTWILRVVGILVVCGGLRGLFGFIETLLKVLPFLSNIFAFGVGIVCNVVGFVWSLLIIALAWIFYRPLIGIIILVVIGGVIFLVVKKGKAKKAAEAASAPSEPEA